MMEGEGEDEDHESSFGRNKSSIVANITCCFNGATHHRRASLDGASPLFVPHHRRSSTSSWFKSKTNDLPEINKGRCRNFFGSRVSRRRHFSADFSYDPLSYSLNFDEDSPSSSNNATMGFNARLPVTPPRKTSKTTTTLPYHDHHHLPRSPKLNDIMASSGSARSKAGNDDLRKGFEALSVSMHRSKLANSNETEPEEVTSTMTTMASSSNQEILLQIC